MNLESLEANVSAAGSALSSLLNVPTHYETLNVDIHASRIMIREAYLRLKNLYSNNSEGLYGLDGMGDMSRQISELDHAFSVLNDDVSRAEYDRKIFQKEQSAAVSEWTNEADLWKPLTNHTSQELIQTSRSTLKITRTQASGSGDKLLQEKFVAALNEGDFADGSMLVKLREIAGVSHQELHDRTKISLDYIKWMENNSFDRLPQVVYVKGFMRSYLRYLNVPNIDKIVVAYAARLDAWQAGQK